MDEKAKNVRAQQWVQTIHACNSSGMRKADWCKANGICLKSFYNWQRRLRNQLACNVQPCLPEETSQAIVPVPIGMSAQPALQEERIVLRKGGCDIELPCTIAPEYIAALVKALVNA